MKFSLVPNWREAWRWISMQMLALAAVWETIPEEAKMAVLSPANQGRVTFALIILAALGRIKDQGTAQ